MRLSSPAPSKKALLAGLVAAACALAATGVGGPDSSRAQVLACPPELSALNPHGPPSERFTMLTRINKEENVLDWADPDGLGQRVRSRDVFVVNSRYGNMSPEDALTIVEMIRAAFPCNRLVTLNGLGSDPAAPGYALAPIDHPELWAVMLDWEKADWAFARSTNPEMGPWKGRFGRSLHRLRSWVDVLTAEMPLTPPGPRRVGVASVLVPRWHYGKLGRAIDGQNQVLGRNRGGVQIVGTQAACERGKRRGIHGIRKQAKRLFGQYRQAKRKRRGLALQVSFSSTPEADGNLPVERIPPALAGKCTRHALRRGAGAILFWASPESMASLFEIGRVARLRGP